MFAYCGNSPITYADSEGNKRYYTAVSCEDSDDRIEIYGQGAAVTVSIYGNTIYIDAYITFYGDVSAEYLIAGIENYWEGSYRNANETYDVCVSIYQGKNSNGHTIHTITSKSRGRSWVHRNNVQWGITKESYVVLYEKYYQNTTCDWTMAHEFGHCLGVRDYYTTSNLPGHKKSFQSIMNKEGSHATFSDIQKVIHAFRYNYIQPWYCEEWNGVTI